MSVSGKLNISTVAKEIQDGLPCQEYALGKGLLQPFNQTNSGSRKIMQGTQVDQSMQLQNPEVPIIMGGYETEFMENSSSFVRAKNNMIIISKIPKYPMTMNSELSNYVLVAIEPETKHIKIIRNINYTYISESYGYRMNTSRMDRLNPGDSIPKGTTISRSNSLDEYDNACNGVNMTTVYMGLAKTTEDPIIISDVAAKKGAAPLFDSTPLQINDNDILVNLYGDNQTYKTFPDIGEEIKDGILCAIRREHKEDEALYAQSVERLQEILFTDDRYMIHGRVVDIEVHVNNYEKLQQTMYNAQILKYYNMKLDFCNKIVQDVNDLMAKGYSIDKNDYKTEKIYYESLWTIQGRQTIIDKVFSNVFIVITTMNPITINVGDKITDRYGGKGVVSAVWPLEMMPRYKVTNADGSTYFEYADIIYNQNTVVNRLNPGQNIEAEIIGCGCDIVHRCANILDRAYAHGAIDDDAILQTCFDQILDYLSILNPAQALDLSTWLNKASTGEKGEMLNSIISDGAIYMCIPPMSSGINIDKLREMYKRFPNANEHETWVPQISSNGRYRLVKARRNVIFGRKYIYRLKQFAEEKFSAVSLSSTNIKGENTKSKANKFHKVAHSMTPVRFGDMEFLDMIHMNGEINIQILMLLSTSPKGRRAFEQLLIGDPFVRNIKLPDDATSRQVEKVNVYLKEIGLALIFVKKKKKRNRIKTVVLTLVNNQTKKPVINIVPHELKPRIHELAEARIVNKIKTHKLTPIETYDKEVVDSLSDLSYEQKQKILHQGRVQENINEICTLMKQKQAEGLSGDKLDNYLITATPDQERIVPVKLRVMKIVNPDLAKKK